MYIATEVLRNSPLLNNTRENLMMLIITFLFFTFLFYTLDTCYYSFYRGLLNLTTLILSGATYSVHVGIIMFDLKHFLN